MVKKNELKAMDLETLKSRLEDLRSDLMKINSKRSSKAALENPGKIKHLKRTIARIISYTKNKEVVKKDNG